MAEPEYCARRLQDGGFEKAGPAEEVRQHTPAISVGGVEDDPHGSGDVGREFSEELLQSLDTVGRGPNRDQVRMRSKFPLSRFVMFFQ